MEYSEGESVAGNRGRENKKYQGAEWPCPNCHKPLGVAAKKCNHCGKDFTDAEVTARSKSNFKFQLGCLAVFFPVFAIGYCALQPSAEDRAKQAAERAEQRDQGFHCLQTRDGSHEAVVARTKASLRDPSSFEHVETRISHRMDNGMHNVRMRYRARNGFGGMDVGSVFATISNADCTIVTFDLSG